MTTLQARNLYFNQCEDQYVQAHWLKWRNNNIDSKVLTNWLVWRMKNDRAPIKNLDGSINPGVNQPDDLEQFIATWVNLVK
jgi:hypothetical protein